jgi:hypothetical protein
MNLMTDPRYPIGKFQRPENPTAADRALWLSDLQALPRMLRDAAAAADLDRPYRDGGWTARQVIHHVADSHINSYVRFRLALTEDTPTIKPYDENQWAALEDASSAPPELSLQLIEALHGRWVRLLTSLTGEQWARKLRHPQTGEVDLNFMLALYAWHGRHHVGHLKLVSR